MKFVVPLPPQNAKRPNFNSRGTSPRAFMNKEYREWRHKFDDWFNQWIDETQLQLFRELMYLPGHLDDDDYLYRDSNGKIRPEFMGWSVNLIFVIARPKSSSRAFPVSGGDIDNYTKAIVDGIFENPIAKQTKLNDKFIQDLHATKRYTWYMSDEEPHIEVEIKPIG